MLCALSLHACLVVVSPAPAVSGNLLVNGDVELGQGTQPDAWFPTAFNDKARFAWEEDAQAKGNHALTITKTDVNDRDAHNWWQRVELVKDVPKRLELSLRVRAADMKPGASACAMIQLWDEKGAMMSGAWSDKIGASGDWRTVSTVFDVPKQAHAIVVRAYLTGAGTVWFDDFDLHTTTKALKSSENTPAVSPYEELVRDCASEIPWSFDAEAAKKRAAAEKKPVLAYIRCIDKDEALPAAQRSLKADDVPFTDDGLRKDVLMRAGPLSDPDIAALIERRFVPLLLTYDLSLHGMNPTKPDPLTPIGLSASDVVTPALAVIDAQGKLVHLLHRIGTENVHLIDALLRAALEKARAPAPRGAKAGDAEELFLNGELERASAALQSVSATTGAAADSAHILLSRTRLRLGDLDGAEKAVADLETPEAHLQRGLVRIARGEHEEALAELEKAELPDDHPRAALARFEKAWCLRMLRRHADADARFAELVGETRFGRKSAACLLVSGPRLELSESQIVVTTNDPLPRQTEGVATKTAWNPGTSVEFLLGEQRVDGSFGAHDSASGHGYWDAAISALVGEALLAWKPKLDAAISARADEALAGIRGFLDEWSKRAPNAASGAFDHPYALMYLVEVHESEIGARVIDAIAKAQNADGNWSVYEAARPASFNTALNVMALAKAKAAGWKVPENVLEAGAKALETMRTKSGLFPYSTKVGHEWMTTEWGSIGRDALCEHALLLTGRKTKPAIDKALERFLDHEAELRAPTKKLYDYFNARGHGGYYFFFAHRNAVDAAQWVPDARRKKVFAAVHDAVIAAREFDGTWMDQAMLGRVYGTAMALCILARVGE